MIVHKMRLMQLDKTVGVSDKRDPIYAGVIHYVMHLLPNTITHDNSIVLLKIIGLFILERYRRMLFSCL